MEAGEEGVTGGKMWKIDEVVVRIVATQKDTDKGKALRRQVAKTGVKMGVGVGVEGRVEVNRRRKSMQGWKEGGRNVW